MSCPVCDFFTWVTNKVNFDSHRWLSKGILSISVFFCSNSEAFLCRMLSLLERSSSSPENRNQQLTTDLNQKHVAVELSLTTATHFSFGVNGSGQGRIYFIIMSLD